MPGSLHSRKGGSVPHSTPHRHRARNRWLIRLAAVFTATAAVFGGTVVNAAPAQAQYCAIRVIQVPRPSWAGGAITTYYHPFNVVAVEAGFLIAEGRVAV